MSVDRFRRELCVRSRFVVIVALAGLIGWLFQPGVAAALQGAKGKKGPESEKITGKITQIQKKGKTATLTIEKEGGETLEVLLNPKLKVAVNGKADATFLRPKVWISSQMVFAVDKVLFGKSFQVHPGIAPPAQLRTDPKSPEIYHVCGQVLAADDDSVTVGFGNIAKPQKIRFAAGEALEISVSSNDIDLIAEGDQIEMEGITRGAKFTPQSAIVTLENPLKFDDVFAKDKDSRKPEKGKAAAAKGGKKQPKGKDDEPAGGVAVDPANPFGGLSKDKKEAKPGDKPQSPDAKPE